VELAGLEGDVIALPAGGEEGGDLFALFSCGEARAARVVLADSVGHGFTAAGVAGHIHRLLHKFRDIRDTARLLAALNDEFTLSGQVPGELLRLTTVATATFDCLTGEFNYSYAAHPRMLHWRAREGSWRALGEGLEGFPLGFVAGEIYSQQSVRLVPGDMVLAFSDAVTEVESPDEEQLTAEGFLELAGITLAQLPHPPVIHDFAEALVEAIRHYHGAEDLEDDLTLLTLRRPV
jgi:phosphoserine phosphatase RsbU/P